MLRTQVKKAELIAKKKLADLTARYEKAQKYAKAERYSSAVSTIVKVRKQGLVGLPVVKQMEELLGEIDSRLEAKFDAIIRKKLSESEVKKELAELKAKTPRDLPVHRKITAALERLDKP